MSNVIEFPKVGIYKEDKSDTTTFTFNIFDDEYTTELFAQLDAINIQADEINKQTEAILDMFDK